MFKIICIFCLFSPLLAIDPWDVDVKPGGKFEFNKKSDGENNLVGKSDVLANVLYKKLVALLVSRSKFKNNGDVLSGSTCFEISENKYKIITDYVESEDHLTSYQLRNIDGILTETACQTRAVRVLEAIEYFLQIFHQYWNVLLMAVMILVLCGVIYKSNWSTVSVKTIFISLFCVCIYFWEVKYLIMTAEKDEEAQAVSRCTSDFFFFKSVDEDCIRTMFKKGIPKLLEYGSPVYVIPAILSKAVFGNIERITDFTNKFVLKMCSNISSWYYTPVYITVNVFLYGIILFSFIAFMSHFVFNNSISFDFMFFKVRFHERMRSMGFMNHINTQHQPNNNINNQLQPDNHINNQLQPRNQSTDHVGPLIGIINHLVTKGDPQILNCPNSNCGKTAVEPTPQFIPDTKLKILANKKISKKINISKWKHKRVSSVPDNLWRLGGGDHLSLH